MISSLPRPSSYRPLRTVRGRNFPRDLRSPCCSTWTGWIDWRVRPMLKRTRNINKQSGDRLAQPRGTPWSREKSSSSSTNFNFRNISVPLVDWKQNAPLTFNAAEFMCVLASLLSYSFCVCQEEEEGFSPSPLSFLSSTHPFSPSLFSLSLTHTH